MTSATSTLAISRRAADVFRCSSSRCTSRISSIASLMVNPPSSCGSSTTVYLMTIPLITRIIQVFGSCSPLPPGSASHSRGLCNRQDAGRVQEKPCRRHRRMVGHTAPARPPDTPSRRPHSVRDCQGGHGCRGIGPGPPTKKVNRSGPLLQALDPSVCHIDHDLHPLLFGFQHRDLLLNREGLHASTGPMMTRAALVMNRCTHRDSPPFCCIHYYNSLDSINNTNYILM